MIYTFDQAVQVAMLAHEGQKDMAGQPYILHPMRVAMAQLTLPAKRVAMVHDTVEDSKGRVTFDSLRAINCPEDDLEALALLTHQGKLSTEEYLESMKAIKRNAIATAVKLADLKDNMDITRVRGLSRDGLNAKDLARLNKYMAAYKILMGE